MRIAVVLLILAGCSVDRTNAIVLESGKIYEHIVIDSANAGAVITTSGSGKAVVNGLTVINSHHVRISNVHVRANDNNSPDGIHVRNSHHIELDSIEVEGFAKSGVFIDSSNDVTVARVHAFDNGFAGISAMNVANLSITHSSAENNAGDPTNLTNHSGNGIIVGYGRNVLIDHCRATNNGWAMPRIGNGTFRGAR